MSQQRKNPKIGCLRKFIPTKFFLSAINESLSSRNLILTLVVDESLFPRKFLPAKVSAFKVVLAILIVEFNFVSLRKRKITIGKEHDRHRMSKS